MFTGIIQAQGQLSSAETRGGDLRLHVESASLGWTDVNVGDSIATNGVCLTAVRFSENGFFADVSAETLRLTTVGDWAVGTHLNLEKALTPQSRMGGHIVSGHVDGIGEILGREKDARSERFQIRVPDGLAKFVAYKGSITVDGTSLTVNHVDGNEFELNIVPHTLDNTIFGEYAKGTNVNIEVDVIARYLERLLLGEKAAQKNYERLSESFLASHGYIRS